jgi:hypothetical protein
MQMYKKTYETMLILCECEKSTYSYFVSKTRLGSFEVAFHREGIYLLWQRLPGFYHQVFNVGKKEGPALV